ncbi:hypothetical protein ACFLVG_05200 [Chloroflexota bacterium]
MSHTLFLKIALPAIAIPALIVLFLPVKVMATYVDVVEPLSLLIGSLLALYVSFTYRKQLKTAFIFLSVFLLIYALAIVLFLAFSPILVPYLNTHLGAAETFRLVQAIQFINYSMLFFFCINILRVVNITQLNRNGWILFGVTVPFCGFLAIYPVLPLISGIWNQALPAIVYIARRLLDAAWLIVLIPVLWLYIQHLKSRKRQTLTFTVIIFGTALGLTILFNGLLAVYPVLPVVRDIWYQSLPVISRITMRILDAALIIVLIPVLWLYVQYLKSHQRQSLTFTVIIFGIVCATLFDYLFESVIEMFPHLLTEGSLLRTSIPEMLFIYGYLIIAVGLYAHRKQDEWGFKTVDRAMAGELKLVDEDNG